MDNSTIKAMFELKEKYRIENEQLKANKVITKAYLIYYLSSYNGKIMDDLIFSTEELAREYIETQDYHSSDIRVMEINIYNEIPSNYKEHVKL
jgi:hypothetical protein